MSGCPATLMMFGRVHTCDWTEPHTGHAHHNHDVNVTWTGATAEADSDDDPQTIRAAFDAAPKGVTAHPMVHVSGVYYHSEAMDAAHAETQRLKDEIAMLRRGGEQLGKIIDRQGRELIELTNSQDVIGDDGDGDWEVVWDRLHEMKSALDAAQDEIERKIAQIEAVRIERDQCDAALSAVLKVHQRDGKSSPYCKCGFLYSSCPTVRAVAIGGAS